MNELLTQLTSLLTEPPGNLLYHLVLVFSITGAVQISLRHWRSSRFPQVRRTLIGLYFLLFGQLVLFIVSALSWLAIIDPIAILPPLDRAITLFSLIWIAWLWLFPLSYGLQLDGNALLLLLFFVPDYKGENLQKSVSLWLLFSY